MVKWWKNIEILITADWREERIRQIKEVETNE
jgi:hypothetical protein